LSSFPNAWPNKITPFNDSILSTDATGNIRSLIISVLIARYGFKNISIDVTGTERISYHDIASVFSDEFLREIKYVPVSFDDAEKAMISAGVPGRLTSNLVSLNKIFVSGKSNDISLAVEEVLGQKVQNIRDFVKDYKLFFD
jgi:hypothetical protein